MQIKKQYSILTSKYAVNNFLINLYIAFMFTVFPLYMSEYYSKVRRDKFLVFVVTTVVFAIIITCNFIFFKNENTRIKIKRKLNVTDYAFFSFVLVSFISTITTKADVFYCIVGYTATNKNAGRNMGLLMFVVLLMMYLIISRFFNFKKYVFYAVFLGITAVTLLAILNYYYIDPLGISKLYKNEPMVMLNFTSTLGNKNYLSAFICIALPFSIGVAMTANDTLMKTVAYISTAIQFMGLIVATSDGGFLGLFASLIVLLIMISRDILKLAKLFFLLTVMMFSANVLRLFDLAMKGYSKGYLGISAAMMGGYLSIILTVICTILTAVFVLIYVRFKPKLLPKYILYIVLCVAALLVLTIIVFTIYYTFIDKTTKLVGFKGFLRFNDSWGTHRGFFWIRSINIWKNNFNFWQKLFGSGPETFYYSFKPYFDDLYNLYGECSVNAAHNVYLNTLITHGILGLASYTVFIVSSVIQAAKKASNKGISFICLLIIVAYSIQDFINIANPINTPLFFIFISIVRATEFDDIKQKI